MARAGAVQTLTMRPMSVYLPCCLAVQIMESLGGDALWFDRFVAEHSAIVYYWGLVLMYMLSPKDAYAFSELVEWHATDTYTQVWWVGRWEGGTYLWCVGWAGVSVCNRHAEISCVMYLLWTSCPKWIGGGHQDKECE